MGRKAWEGLYVFLVVSNFFAYRQTDTPIWLWVCAEGNLHNPGLFTDVHLPACQMAKEYMVLVRRFPCSMSCVRGHLFKLLHHMLVP